jgi:hypothetical protein
MVGDSEFRTGSTQSTVVAVWSGEPTAARLAALVRAMRDVYGSNPEGVFLFNVITGRTGMPDKAARDLLARQFEAMRGKLVAAAIVIEHSGVQYTMSRAIIGTLTAIARSPFSMKIFDSRDTAAAWLTITSKVPSQTLLALAAQLESEMSE